MIVDVNIRIHDAGGGAGVIRGCPPRLMQELDLAQFLQHNAAPVCPRSGRSEAAFARAAVLITAHSKFVLPVPPQPVRTAQARKSVINGKHRPSGFNGLIHAPIKSLHPPRSACSKAVHFSRLPLPAQVNRICSIVYNTVILGLQGLERAANLENGRDHLLILHSHGPENGDARTHS